MVVLLEQRLQHAAMVTSEERGVMLACYVEAFPRKIITNAHSLFANTALLEQSSE